MPDMTIRPLEQRRRQLADYRFVLRVAERGRVASVGDGVAWLTGLPSARMDELLAFDDASQAVVFHLGHERLGAILLRQSVALKAGMPAYLQGKGLEIGVGDELLGRVVDPMGHPLDGLPFPAVTVSRPLDIGSPAIIERGFVDSPLYTGCKIVDTMIPIGKGQRQLIIGDNGTGKSSLALDAVLQQKGAKVRCVYVLIGQKRSSVVQVIETLRQKEALGYTTVVVAEATALPGMKYLAPFSGCTIAEYWAWHGHDTLVVYDDLTTHAMAYRELSLLLRRPPGREAYPGDIFYLHARLLERTTRLGANYGGGSMTALPIVETEQGEIASYIPTNLISITDGQIYLDAQLFSRGILPAIDVTRSVSRIGGKAQEEIIKAEAGRMKLDYLQFLELEVFTRFGAKLEASMEKRIKRGRLLREILKQGRMEPLPVEAHLAWLLAFNDGLLDEMSDEQLPAVFQLFRDNAQTGLSLAAGRDAWLQAVRNWMRGVKHV